MPQPNTEAHYAFAQRVQDLLADDARILGCSLGGSWGKAHFDEYSDLDFIFVVQPAHWQEVMDERWSLLPLFGSLLTQHQHSDARLIVALYDAPPRLLHVDLKWVLPDDYKKRVETPTVLWEHDGALTRLLAESEAHFPAPTLQEIEARIWTWLHYCLTKLARGERLEAAAYLQETALYSLAPLMQQLHQRTPQRFRRAESLPPADYERLCAALPPLDEQAIFQAIRATLDNYCYLRSRLASADFQANTAAESALRRYIATLEQNFQN